MSSPGTVMAYVGLGSNLGDKQGNVDKALALLAAAPGVRLRRRAPFYRTAPVGYTEQDCFINTVVEIETVLPPLELLELLLAFENQLGRVRKERWGPRTLDLDLLIYGQVTMNTQRLTLPHPRMHERAFVMVPLADLSPRLSLPGLGQTADLALELKKRQAIELITKQP